MTVVTTLPFGRPLTRDDLQHLLVKRDRYQAAGIASYWIVDPTGPALTALELDGSVYVERAHGSGDDSLTVDQPFPISVDLARLLD